MQLPSVTRFIKEIASDLESGKCVLISIPNYPILDLRTGIESKIKSFNKEVVYLDVKKLTTGNHHSPGEILCDRFNIDREGSNESCIQSLISIDRFLDSIPIIYSTEESHHEEWLSFLTSYQIAMVQKGRPHERTPICFISEGLTSKSKSNSGLSVHHWSGLATKMDTEYLLTFSSDHNFTLEALLRIKIIQELSGYDWSLTNYLSKFSIEQLLSPIDILKIYSQTMPLGWELDEPVWKSGGMDNFNGQQFINSAYLASNDREDEILKRIWKAQIKIIYPFLEELRLAVLAIYSDSFNRGWDLLIFQENDRYKPNDIFGLEIGQLSYIAWKYNGFHTDVVDMLNIMRIARNDLAHRRPISHDFLKKLEEYKEEIEQDI